MSAKKFHRFSSLLIVLALVLGGTSPALAAPSNDNFANAENIGSLPFSVTVDTSLAGLEPNEPNFPNCFIMDKTVWYKFTPTETMLVRPEARWGIVNIYRSSGPGISDLTFLSCQATIFTAEAGQTYYLQAGTTVPTEGGNIQVILRQVIPPANDNFTNAETITSLPFSANVDVTFATLETREIRICGLVENLTIWYSFTPTENMLVQTDTFGGALSGFTEVEVYVSPGPTPDISELIPIGCSVDPSSFSFLAEAGQTYYFRVGITRFGQTETIQFTLEQLPPPVLEVAIDIKPGNARNRIEIEPGDDEKVLVAILSTAQFSAVHQVDRTSLTFGATGDENSLVLKGRKKQPDCQVRDVNKDHLLDLVCKFTIGKTGFQPGDTEGFLKGLTMEGAPFEGSDSVVIKLKR